MNVIKNQPSSLEVAYQELKVFVVNDLHPITTIVLAILFPITLPAAALFIIGKAVHISYTRAESDKAPQESADGSWDIKHILGGLALGAGVTLGIYYFSQNPAVAPPVPPCFVNDLRRPLQEAVNNASGLFGGITGDFSSFLENIKGNVAGAAGSVVETEESADPLTILTKNCIEIGKAVSATFSAAASTAANYSNLTIFNPLSAALPAFATVTSVINADHGTNAVNLMSAAPASSSTAVVTGIALAVTTTVAFALLSICGRKVEAEVEADAVDNPAFEIPDSQGEKQISLAKAKHLAEQKRKKQAKEQKPSINPDYHNQAPIPKNDPAQPLAYQMPKPNTDAGMSATDSKVVAPEPEEKPVKVKKKKRVFTPIDINTPKNKPKKDVALPPPQKLFVLPKVYPEKKERNIGRKAFIGNNAHNSNNPGIFTSSLFPFAPTAQPTAPGAIFNSKGDEIPQIPLPTAAEQAAAKAVGFVGLPELADKLVEASRMKDVQITGHIFLLEIGKFLESNGIVNETIYQEELEETYRPTAQKIYHELMQIDAFKLLQNKSVDKSADMSTLDYESFETNLFRALVLNKMMELYRPFAGQIVKKKAVSSNVVKAEVAIDKPFNLDDDLDEEVITQKDILASYQFLDPALEAALEKFLTYTNYSTSMFEKIQREGCEYVFRAHGLNKGAMVFDYLNLKVMTSGQFRPDIDRSKPIAEAALKKYKTDFEAADSEYSKYLCTINLLQTLPFVNTDELIKISLSAFLNQHKDSIAAVKKQMAKSGLESDYIETAFEMCGWCLRFESTFGDSKPKEGSSEYSAFFQSMSDFILPSPFKNWTAKQDIFKECLLTFNLISAEASTFVYNLDSYLHQDQSSVLVAKFTPKAAKLTVPAEVAERMKINEDVLNTYKTDFEGTTSEYRKFVLTLNLLQVLPFKTDDLKTTSLPAFLHANKDNIAAVREQMVQKGLKTDYIEVTFEMYGWLLRYLDIFNDSKPTKNCAKSLEFSKSISQLLIDHPSFKTNAFDFFGTKKGIFMDILRTNYGVSDDVSHYLIDINIYKQLQATNADINLEIINRAEAEAKAEADIAKTES